MVPFEQRRDEMAAEVLDLLPERVVRYRLPDFTIVYCNSAWAAFNKLCPADVVGRSLREFLSDDGNAGLELAVSRLSADTPVLADPVARQDLDTPDSWMQWVDRLLPCGEVIATGRDVSAQYLAERQLAESEVRFRDLADHSADVVWRFRGEPRPHFDYMSPSVERVLGHPPEYFLEDFRRLLDMVDEDGRQLIFGALRGEALPDRCDFRYLRDDGAVVIGEMHATAIPNGLQGVSRDVTQLRALQAELQALALHDPLTGLANRRLLDELLAAALARTERTGAEVAVAYIDLDDFKIVNDTFGHDAGDLVLCEVARRLLDTVRGADVAARVGGDEFVVVHDLGAGERTNLAQRIEAALADPYDLGGLLVTCRASVGQTDTRRVGVDAAALVAGADADMFEVKRARGWVPHPLAG